jgi:hypothetical protein
MQSEFSFEAKVWLYPGMQTAWHFVSVPKPLSEEIKERSTIRGVGQSTKRRGWGSVPVQVTIGKSTWKTAVFPDKRSGSYLLPLKAKIRSAEDVFNGDTVFVLIQLAYPRQPQK